MSYRNSYLVEDCNHSKDMSSDLFEGILSDVESFETEESASEHDRLIDYLQGAPVHQSHNVKNTQTKLSKSMHSSVKAESMCMSRNAIMARENRQKKKEYVTNLENSMKNLKEENTELKNKSQEMLDKISELVSEVDYLKGVIANQTTLSKLIGSISTTPGVKFYSSLALNNNTDQENDNTKGRSELKRKKESDKDQENTIPDKVRKSTRRVQSNKRYSDGYMNESSESVGNFENTNKGICLHVAGDSVSLEFCSMCSRNATNTKNTTSTSATCVLKERKQKRKK